MPQPSFPGFSRLDFEHSELDDATNLLAVDDPGATVREAIVAILRVCVAGGRSSDFPLSRGVVVLGRSPDVDIQLKHKSVSRRHLELRIEGAQITATDLESTAGTFVDGNRISAPTLLSLGGSLALGEQRIELHALHAPQSRASLTHTADIRTTLPGVVIPPRREVPAPPPPRPTIPTTAPTFDELALAARSPAFAELQSADRDALLGLVQRLDVQSSQVVLAPGQALDFVLVVVSGQLQVYDGGHSIGAIGPGECVELLQLVRAEPSRVEVRADASVRILWLDAASFRAVLARDTASAQLLARCLEWPGAARFRLLLHHYGVDRGSAVQLIGSLNVRSAAAGSQLARENTSATTLQIVTRGVVSATRLIDGTPMPLSELREGSIFGGAEISLEKPYSLSYTAVTDVELLVIERRHVIDALHRAPELSTLLDAFATNRPPPVAQPDAVDQPDDDDDPEAPPVSTFKKNGGVKLLRRPRPVLVRQHDKMDCGAACLAMVSLAYGRRLSLARFRAQVHVTREGASMWSLVRVARQTGFEVVGVQCALQGLKNLQLPAIALLQYHYVVIYEIKDTYVLCGDPGCGLVRVPIDEFKRGFSSMVLLMRPKREFFQNPHSLPGWRKYLALRTGHLLPALEILLAAFVQFGFGLAAPLLTQVIYDRVLVSRDTTLLTLVVLAMATISALNALMMTVKGYLIGYAANRFDTVFSALVYRHVMRLPLNFFMVRHVGDILSRFREIKSIRDFIIGGALQAVIQVTSIGLYVGVLFLFNTTLGLLTLGLVPLVTLAAVATSKRLRRMMQENFPNIAGAEGVLVEQLRSLETVKSLGAEIAGRWRWEEAFRRGLIAKLRIDKLRVVITTISYGTQQFALVAITYAAARMAINGELTIGTVIAVTMLASQIFAPVQALAQQWVSLQTVANSFARIDDIISTPTEADGPKVQPPEQAAEQESRRLQGDIELNRVSFQYGSDLSPWAINELSMTIKRGETVALVGRSGSGKTTLVQLLNLLYSPTRGKILIGGKDITELDLTRLRDSIGMVMQDSSLFAGSVFDNIAFGQENASLELVMAAARVANAHGFISTMKDGYQTKLKEGGVGLSGGQRQRINLARALFRRPTILVLDEATSALDSESEKAIVEAMKVFCRGRTSIIIAHRLSTVLHADRIILMERGRIIETGSHRELIARGGEYVKLFGAQLSL